MRVNVDFSENDASMKVNFSDSNTDIDVNFGNVQTVNLGENGLSAYEIAVKNGFEGTETEWLESLQGETGPRGPQGERGEIGLTGPRGEQGVPGQPGYTPVKNVDYFDGEPGKSAYEYAKDAGYTGTEDEFAEKLAADDGGSADGAVLYTEQSLTEEQKAQARENIGVVGTGESPRIELSDFSDSSGSGVRVNVYNVDGLSYFYPIYDGRDGTSAFAEVSKSVEIGSNVGITTITTKDATGTKTAKVYDGKDGEDGITPHIGANGNWFIVDTDTGKPSRGEDGVDGKDGKDGYTPIKGVDYFDGEPGVWVGSAAPTDNSYVVWVDPNGESFEHGGESSDSASAVLYTEQTLTEEQKAQARENIGAAAIGENSGSGGNVDTVTKNMLLQFLLPVLKSAVYDADQSGNILALEQLFAPSTIVPATSITVSHNQLTFADETPQTVTATVVPKNTTDPVVWISSDRSIATVANGIITPVSNGECVITAKAGNCMAMCNVVVRMGVVILSNDLDIAIGSYSFHSSNERVAYIAESKTRAAINPLCIYLTPGRTYKVYLTDYSRFFCAVYIAKTNTQSKDFNYTNGTTVTFWLDITRTVDSGWLYKDYYEFTATEDDNLLGVTFSRKDDGQFTENDIVELKSLFVIEEV